MLWNAKLTVRVHCLVVQLFLQRHFSFPFFVLKVWFRGVPENIQWSSQVNQITASCCYCCIFFHCCWHHEQMWFDPFPNSSKLQVDLLRVTLLPSSTVGPTYLKAGFRPRTSVTCTFRIRSKLVKIFAMSYNRLIWAEKWKFSFEGNLDLFPRDFFFSLNSFVSFLHPHRQTHFPVSTCTRNAPLSYRYTYMLSLHNSIADAFLSAKLTFELPCLRLVDVRISYEDLGCQIQVDRLILQTAQSPKVHSTG